MSWWSKNGTIPVNDSEFNSIISGLVFNCPVCIEKRISEGMMPDGKKKYKIEKKAVSARNSTFRSRNVCGHLLITVLAQIRRPLVRNAAYALLDSNDSIEDKVQEIINGTTMSDTNFELVVFQKRTDMSDTEAFYYYIRNAFAHGSFEIINTDAGKIYKLESSKEGSIKAQMRLKESSLKRYIDYSMLSASEIKALQKRSSQK